MVSKTELASKWERNYSEKAPVIVANATSPEASERYKKGIAKVFGISESDVADEDAKRVSALKKLTPEELRSRVKGKGIKWYENTRRGFLLKREVV